MDPFTLNERDGWPYPGDDKLTGGTGADQFVFHPGFGHDTITDFNHNQRDVLYIEELIGPDTVNTVPPATCTRCVGVFVPMPRRLVVLSHHRLSLPESAPAEKPALSRTWVITSGHLSVFRERWNSRRPSPKRRAFSIDPSAGIRDRVSS